MYPYFLLTFGKLYWHIFLSELEFSGSPLYEKMENFYDEFNSPMFMIIIIKKMNGKRIYAEVAI